MNAMIASVTTVTMEWLLMVRPSYHFAGRSDGVRGITGIINYKPVNTL